MVSGAGTQLWRRYSRHGSAIELGVESWQRTQGLQFGSECENPSNPAVVERLLAKTVTQQVELSVPPVPEGSSEHPLAGIERPIDSPALDCRQQHLSVGAASEEHPGAFQSPPDLGMVVDLSVVGQHPPATGRDHWLRSAHSEIDDSQTPVPERHSCVSVDPEATVVGPTMLHGRSHGRRQGAQPVGTRRRGRVEDAGDPAHAGSARPSTWRVSGYRDLPP